ncbi:NUDIX domain-containing protein [Streptomyces sp. NBC_01089]|uniref:NUDIX domain-containing protein n=1 Tax=Streptomyces sp. NBC_01089 TaxID=2903747 RepID=UPI003868E431|nr:NUDIX domain-containing protein [Streptomyces sp. NBC_01089]
MTERHRSITNVMVLLQRPSDGRVLTVRHGQDSSHSPGQLTVIGGHLEKGEFCDEGAARELLEEAGVHVGEGELEFCQLSHFRTQDDHVIGVAFAAQQWQGEPYNREQGKHTALVWVDPGQPPSDCHPFTAAVLRNFAAGVLYAQISAPEQEAGAAA